MQLMFIQKCIIYKIYNYFPFIYSLYLLVIFFEFLTYSNSLQFNFNNFFTFISVLSIFIEIILGSPFV